MRAAGGEPEHDEQRTEASEADRHAHLLILPRLNFGAEPVDGEKMIADAQRPPLAARNGRNPGRRRARLLWLATGVAAACVAVAASGTGAFGWLVLGLVLGALATAAGLAATMRRPAAPAVSTADAATLAVLRELEPAGWAVAADPVLGCGAPDVVATGPAGAFRVESLALAGTLAVESGLLTCRRAEAPARSTLLSWVAGNARGRAAALAASHAWPHVRPVIVVWGDFPQRRVEQDGVVYVAGAALAAWLGSLPPAAGTPNSSSR